jgi:hypothetical protein
MTPSQSNTSSPSRTDSFRWDRLDVAAAFAAFSSADSFPSQRQFAQQHGIPRSTLGSWLRRPDPDGVDPDLTDFLRRPCGEAFLRQIVLSLFLVFHFRSTTGLRALGSFLELTGLDRFVAASYGALHHLAELLEADLIAFADEERSRLGSDMPQRDVALALDENFHRSQPYLVAIEPSSNFILLEQHSPTRDGPTWTAALKSSLEGLNVRVVLMCSDRAKGLLACARDGFGVPHSPDLMHAQRDLLQLFLSPLRRQIASSEKELQQEQLQLLRWQQAREDYYSGPHGPGRPPEFARHIEMASNQVEQGQQRLEVCEQRLEEVKQAVRELADQAHPFDPATGEGLDAKAVQERLERPLEKLVKMVEEAELSEKASIEVWKGYDWMVAVLAVVSWFWQMARQRVEGMNLPEEAEQAVYRELLPGLYWQQQTRRGRDAEQKRKRQELSEKLLKQAWREGGPLSRLGEEERKEVQRQAQQIAGLFVRSSSCVEGRNGRLSLLQHGHVRMSSRRLKAQTVIHNYLTRREDGSTAAERFFGRQQRDLFGHLLQGLPNLPRPAAKRPKQARKAPPTPL